MNYELVGIIIDILGILLGVFVAYHVYNLSKQQTFGDRFAKRQSIQKQIDDLLHNIRNGGNSKIEFINVAKYDRHYPVSNTETRKGYTFLGAELKNYHYAGVEFFCKVIAAYKLEDNKYSRKRKLDNQQEANLFMVGTIPYDWVESIDIRGDDTTNRPQFYTHFKGKNRSPYKSICYYLKTSESLIEFTEVELS